MTRSGILLALLVTLGPLNIYPSAHALASRSFGFNVIRNGRAEAAAGATGNSTAPVPDFTTTSHFTTSKYDGGSGDLSPTSPGPSDRGANYFYGGPNNVSSSATQVDDVSAGASAIDAGTVSYTLSAYLGGLTNQRDNATLTVRFEDGAGHSLGRAKIGPVLVSDRGGVSKLLFRQTTGHVPVGTRRVRVVLQMTRLDGSDNDGLADDLSLVLSPHRANLR